MYIIAFQTSKNIINLKLEKERRKINKKTLYYWSQRIIELWLTYKHLPFSVVMNDSFSEKINPIFTECWEEKNMIEILLLPGELQLGRKAFVGISGWFVLENFDPELSHRLLVKFFWFCWQSSYAGDKVEFPTMFLSASVTDIVNATNINSKYEQCRLNSNNENLFGKLCKNKETVCSWT